MATDRGADPASEHDPSHLSNGPGRVIVALYAVMALAATGRSSVQVAEYFGRAPFAYLMSVLAAVVYLVATVALVKGGGRAVQVVLVSASVELAGVLLVGTLSYAVPGWFPDKTVWSHYGQGYGYVPLVLPVLGLWWVRRFLPRTR